MHLQSTFGAFLVAFTMVNGTPVLPQNDQNSRGITAPVKVDNLPNKHIDNLPDNHPFNIPEVRNYQYKPKDKAGPNDNDKLNPADEYQKMIFEQDAKLFKQDAMSGKARGEAQAGKPRKSKLRTGGGAAPAAPPVKRGRTGGRGRVGWKGKPELDERPKPSRSDGKGPNPDRKNKGPEREKGTGYERKDGDSGNPIRDGIYDGLNEGLNTGSQYAAEEIANQAANNEKRKVPVPAKNKPKDFDRKGDDASRRTKPGEPHGLDTTLNDLAVHWEPTKAQSESQQPANNEKRKVPVPDADKKKKKNFDDLKEKLERNGGGTKPSWTSRIEHPCGGPACIDNPYYIPNMQIDDNPIPWAGVQQKAEEQAAH